MGMQQHAEMIKTEMFLEAAKLLIDGLDELHTESRKHLLASYQDIVESLRFFVQGNIEMPVQRKAEILETICSCLARARNAFDHFKGG
jgi:hypothetical protein